MSETRKLRRVITNLRHGGHALSQGVYKADPHASAIETLTTVEAVIDHAQPADLTLISTPFGYLFDDLQDDIGITDTTLEPLPPERVRRDLRNLRDPAVNLDSLYGNGPAASSSTTPSSTRSATATSSAPAGSSAGTTSGSACTTS
jgi:hypothetical protein